jgi:hypothetical protein
MPICAMAGACCHVPVGVRAGEQVYALHGSKAGRAACVLARGRGRGMSLLLLERAGGVMRGHLLAALRA